MSDPVVNKQGFTKKRVQNMLEAGPLDAVVIGSGMAGLTSAGLLALAGWRVLVLEQHDVAGGTTHAFVEKNKYEFDTGLHYVGASLVHSRVLAAISGNRLAFSEQDPDTGVYDVATAGGERVSMSRGHDALCDQLCKQFPEDAEPLRAYFQQTKLWEGVIALMVVAKWLPTRASIGAAACSLTVCLWALGLGAPQQLLWGCGLSWFVLLCLEPLLWLLYDRLASVSTLDRMRSLGLSERAISVLTYNWGDYGTLPSGSPFFVQSIHMNHWAGGGFYPVGGPAEIARQIIPTIEAAGGACLVRAPVDRIELDGSGAVAGVLVKGFYVPTRRVISAVGAHGLYTKLLADQPLPPPMADMRALLRESGQRRADVAASSCTMISLFVALEGDPEELELPAYNLWSFRSWDHEANVRRMMQADSIDDCEFAGGFVAFPSQKDPDWGRRWPGCVVCEVLVPVNWDWFAEWDQTRIHARGQEYDQMKRRVSDRLLGEFLYRHFPQCEGKVVFCELGTPLSNNFYFGTADGEVYGLDHSLARFSASTQKRLKWASEVPGLYLSGQDTMINGIMGALMSGTIAAAAVSKTMLLWNLKHLWRAKPMLQARC